jgi:hypothetical protein
VLQTLRELPQLARIQPDIKDETMIIKADGMESSISIPLSMPVQPASPIIDTSFVNISGDIGVMVGC